MYFVYEVRGYGVEYKVFDYESKRLAIHKAIELANSAVRDGRVNGNDEPFNYEVRDIDGFVYSRLFGN